MYVYTQQNISFESVATDDTFWVGCTNLNIVYQNIVLASYKFFVHVWLQNKNRFADVVGTQITRFSIKMNHKISNLKGLQMTAPNRLGAQTSTQCTRTLCLPPISFLFIWLQNKIRFANMVGTKITSFLIKMNHKISHLIGSIGQHQMSQVHNHPHSVLEHYVYLLQQLYCSCG